MKLISFLLPLLAVVAVAALANPEMGIYGGGPLYPTKNPKMEENIKLLKASGLTTVIAWSLHIHANGDVVYNDYKIASNGEYVGEKSWPHYLKDLKTGHTSVKHVHLSVGSAGAKDFEAIANLIKVHGTGHSNPLYKNFHALKKALPMVDTIDLDCEEPVTQETIVKFSLLIGSVGFKVSFCPYQNQPFWINCLKEVNHKVPKTVTHFNLQVYDGGSGNDVAQWQKAVHQAGFKIPVYAGVMVKQSGAGGDDHQQIQNKFKTWAQQGVKGGFFWLFDQMTNTTASYTTAMKRGFAGK
jgi:hypothetical protein